MAKKETTNFGFKKGNLQRQKVLPSKEPKMSEYDHLKGWYKPKDLPIEPREMPFHD